MARQHWASRTAFLLAAIGSAVGLGNIWRFPYMTAKFGGGAFLIPYLLALFVLGIPLLLLEFAIGQKLQAGAIAVFKGLHRKWAGLGVFALISGFLVIAYYAVVMAWSLLYLISSFGVRWAGKSEEYFTQTVLQLSDGVGSLGGINIDIFLALIVVWVLIYFCIWKGVRSVGAIVWFTVPLPVVLLGVLLIRGVTLPGFLEGWIYYLKPNWAVLASPEVWTAAASQIFFTLSVAFGVMIAYASYNKKKEMVVQDTFITALTNSGISLFAGFVVFAVLGHMAVVKGVTVAEAAAAGPGLAFVVFPEALSLMPFAWFFSFLFFVTLLTLGIDSAFSIVEGINAGVKDLPWGKKLSVERLALIMCTLLFLAGIIFTTRAGLYMLDIVDHFVLNYNIVLSGLFMAVLAGWVYGVEKVRAYVNSISTWQLGRWWSVCIKYVIPVILVVLLVLQFLSDVRTPYEGYPMWALSIGWACVGVPLLLLLVSLVVPRKA